MTIATQATGKQWTVASETRANVLYMVKHVGGYFSCDCLGHYSHGQCKHADTVKAAQPMPATDPMKIEIARRLGILAPAK